MTVKRVELGVLRTQAIFAFVALVQSHILDAGKPQRKSKKATRETISLPVERILKFLLVLKPSVLFFFVLPAAQKIPFTKNCSLHKFKLKSFFKTLAKEKKSEQIKKKQEYNLNIVFSPLCVTTRIYQNFENTHSDDECYMAKHLCKVLRPFCLVFFFRRG